jgi:hypothetical protein
LWTSPRRNSDEFAVVPDSTIGVSTHGQEPTSPETGSGAAGRGPAPTRVQGVTIVRSGGHFFGAQTFPALWLFSATNKFQAIRVSDLDIVDPTYSGIMFQTNYVNGQSTNPITDTKFTGVSITGARRSGDELDAKSGFGLWANEFPEPGQGPAVGAVTFDGLRLEHNVDTKNTTTTFTIIR